MRTELNGSSLVSMDHLNDIAEGRPSEIRKLSQMYLRTMEDYLRKLRLAAAGANFAQMSAIAHAAAGASAFMGVGGLAFLLRKIERLGKQGETARVRELMPDVENLFEQIRQFLIQQTMQAVR